MEIVKNTYMHSLHCFESAFQKQESSLSARVSNFCLGLVLAIPIINVIVNLAIDYFSQEPHKPAQLDSTRVSRAASPPTVSTPILNGRSASTASRESVVADFARFETLTKELGISKPQQNLATRKAHYRNNYCASLALLMKRPEIFNLLNQLPVTFTSTDFRLFLHLETQYIKEILTKLIADSNLGYERQSKKIEGTLNKLHDMFPKLGETPIPLYEEGLIPNIAEGLQKIEQGSEIIPQFQAYKMQMALSQKQADLALAITKNQGDEAAALSIALVMQKPTVAMAVAKLPKGYVGVSDLRLFLHTNEEKTKTLLEAFVKMYQEQSENSNETTMRAAFSGVTMKAIKRAIEEKVRPVPLFETKSDLNISSYKW